MIQSIHIQNFKSVVDLSLDLGRFNVLIGENGCGKSNILEAIAFGAAASADKLDYEFMGSRGIRLPNPDFMYSAFSNIINDRIVRLDIKTDIDEYNFELTNDVKNSKKWYDLYAVQFEGMKLVENSSQIKKHVEVLKKIKSMLSSVPDKDKLNIDDSTKTTIIDRIDTLEREAEIVENGVYKLLEDIENHTIPSEISNFIIYSPEESRLRKFEDSDHIYPLGIKGQGLFQYLKEFTLDTKNEAAVQEIKDTLALLDWYKDFGLPDNLMRNEFALSIQDKYLDERLRYFDQRSTNEGFLFLLFYATLFISDLTPTFFAIDNIEASFNPKLCTKLISTLVQLAKKHNKQVIVTTHNPAVLDGLDLQDDSQRLFVVRRNDEGHTRARRIEHKPERTMKLSEIWTSGFIGGLPSNF